MDKFTRIFEADMQNSLGNIEEADIKDKKKRPLGGKLAAGMVVGGLVGSTVPLIKVGARTAKTGNSIKTALKQHPKMTTKVLERLMKNMGKAGTIVGGGATYSAMVANALRKKKVAESAIENVEEGIGSTVAGLLAKVKGLKAVKQAGNVVNDLKDIAKAAGPRNKLYRGIGKTKFGALKANTGAVGRGVTNTAKANPYGAALVGGGTLGAAGLTAWGLKKPKKSVYEAAPFNFSKLKDKKDGGKGTEKDGTTPAQEALAKAKEKDKKKGLPDFLKNGKGDKDDTGDEKKDMKAMHGKMKKGGMKDEKDMSVMEKMKMMKEKHGGKE